MVNDTPKMSDWQFFAVRLQEHCLNADRDGCGPSVYAGGCIFLFCFWGLGVGVCVGAIQQSRYGERRMMAWANGADDGGWRFRNIRVMLHQLGLEISSEWHTPALRLNSQHMFRKRVTFTFSNPDANPALLQNEVRGHGEKSSLNVSIVHAVNWTPTTRAVYYSSKNDTSHSYINSLLRGVAICQPFIHLQFCLIGNNAKLFSFEITQSHHVRSGSAVRSHGMVMAITGGLLKFE